MKREYESVEYRFSEEELLAIGLELGNTNQQIYDFRSGRTAAMKSLAASIKGAEQRAAELTTMLVRKSEMRDVEVVAVMDTPEAGLKTIVRADTSQVLRVAVMTLEERQTALDFGGQEPEK